jgi:hypothetical protein
MAERFSMLAGADFGRTGIFNGTLMNLKYGPFVLSLVLAAITLYDPRSVQAAPYHSKGSWFHHLIARRLEANSPRTM